MLRCADATTPDRIRHIPRVLYHWRALAHSAAASPESKPYAIAAGIKAVDDCLRRHGVNGHVERGALGYYQAVYEAPAPTPLVSIIVPTTLRNRSRFVASARSSIPAMRTSRC